MRRAGDAINSLLNVGPGTTTFSLTFNTSGGAAAGSTFNGSAALIVDYHTVGAQPLDGTLTALAGATWSAGTQVLTLTAADTVTLKTVGSAAGNILDKAAGDALYQPLDTDLTSIAGLTFSQGDLIYRDGSGLQRLAAGTSGQVLKTGGAGANPSWGRAPFRGARVKKSANLTGQNLTAAPTVVTFDAEDFDTGGYHDNVTNNSRLTTLSGENYVEVVANLLLNNVTASTLVHLFIYKNGSEIARASVTPATVAPGVYLSTGPLAVTGGTDYFEMYVQVGAGDTSVDILASTTRFSINVLE